MVEKKYLIILSQESNRFYPGGNVMFCLDLTIIRLKFSNNLSIPHVFACWVFVCLVSRLIIF